MTKPKFTKDSNENDLQWKKTSKQYVKSWISQQPLIRSYSNFKLKIRLANTSIQMLQMKTTFTGRITQNIKIEISQQPLIGSSLNFILKLRWPNWSLQILQMAIYNMLKVEYLSKPLSDLAQILNLTSGEHTKVYTCFKCKRPPMEEDLKLLKLEYLSNLWLGLPYVLYLSSGDQT